MTTEQVTDQSPDHSIVHTEVPEGYQEITDAQVIGQMVVAWHTQAVNRVRTMANIPDHVAIEETDPQTGIVTIYSPEQVRAYRQGMLYALEGFEQLPFLVTTTPEPEESAP